MSRLAWRKTTLVQRFSLLCLAALILFGVALGWIVTSSLERNMLQRSEQLVASIVSDEVRNEFAAADLVTPKLGSEYDVFSDKMSHLSFGPDIVRVKIWNRDRVVVWSDEEQLVGQSFPDNDDLGEALNGAVVSEMELLHGQENTFESSFERLLELYVPIRFGPQAEIETVFEVYRNLDPLYADISQHNRVVWVWTVLGFATLFLVLVGIVWRASRRIEAQTREIAESEVRYRTLVQSAQDSIMSFDHAGTITLFNAAAENMFGYSAGEMIGKPVESLVAWKHLSDGESAIKRFLETSEATGPGKTIEVDGVRGDGQVFPMELSLSVAEDDNASITGIMRDISERKAAEAMEQQLQHAGRLLTLGELAAGVAHELNNPLAAVQGYAQLLTSRKDLDDSVRADLDTIYGEAQRASRITGNLLSFSRSHEPQKSPTLVNEVVETSVELHAYRMRVNNVDILMELDQGIPAMMADAHQLQQVFANLITNAEQAIAQAHGKGTLRIKTQTVGEMVQITFTDDGPGIPPENMDKIFESFFTTKEVGKGTGLGLSICHKIVQNHGGDLRVESKLEEGTTFSVEIPIAHDFAPEAADTTA